MEMFSLHLIPNAKMNKHEKIKIGVFQAALSEVKVSPFVLSASLVSLESETKELRMRRS